MNLCNFNQTYMKRIITLMTLCSLVLIAANLFSNPEGAPINTSGAPNESTCAQSGCHVGTLNPSNGGSVSIKLTGDSATYTPGVQYEMNVTVALSGKSVFGFSFTAKNPGLSNTGTLTNGGNTAVQVIAKYATHTVNGKTGSGSKSWKFKWTAPATNVGMVTLYACGNAANGNGSATGDFIYTAKLVIPCGAVGIDRLMDRESMEIYPIPAHDRLIIGFDLKENARVDLTLIDLQGKELNHESYYKAAGQVELSLPFENQPESGIYLLKCTINGESISRKVFIQ